MEFVHSLELLFNGFIAGIVGTGAICLICFSCKYLYLGIKHYKLEIARLENLEVNNEKS